MGNRLTLKEQIYLLQQEIIWCLDHPDKELTLEQQMGFMNGLRQAQILLERAENAKEKSRCVHDWQASTLIGVSAVCSKCGAKSTEWKVAE